MVVGYELFGRCVDPRNFSPSGDMFTAKPVGCFDFGVITFVANLVVDDEDFDLLLLPTPPLLPPTPGEAPRRDDDDDFTSLSSSRFALGRDVLRLLNLGRLKDGIINLFLFGRVAQSCSFVLFCFVLFGTTYALG